ncbi:hypothetical protein AJ80_05993 [Polytolypa hystricis UAMH7299]|uniref:Flavoprotein domain-containing protein n=1 Tax=Polytolypa hystricis (strain UAMH7299) TaxID=1447883 RepID=A0A2B7XZP6_POLH7|nr:hypothetical protein AJ80_05993 [Polytolypa hystricis UAMH7299]
MKFIASLLTFGLLASVGNAAAAGSRRQADEIIPSPSPIDPRYACKADWDCAIVDHGNCCGYYPTCARPDARWTPEERCPGGGASVCGWPVIESCTCEDNACKPVYGAGNMFVEQGEHVPCYVDDVKLKLHLTSSMLMQWMTLTPHFSYQSHLLDLHLPPLLSLSFSPTTTITITITITQLKSKTMTTQPALSPASAVAASLSDGKPHLLLAASGSVATIKLPQIITTLTTAHPSLSIRLILTSSAAHFLAGQSTEQPTLASLASIPGVDGIHLDADEWDPAWRRDAPNILHIELRRWAHLLAITPLSANSLAKITNGMCDNLLTSVVRAWDVERGARIVVAPAMNGAMWTHPVTKRQIGVLEEEWGVGKEGEGWFEVLRPQIKALACGDVAIGGMCEWTDIVRVIEERLGFKKG